LKPYKIYILALVLGIIINSLLIIVCSFLFQFEKLSIFILLKYEVCFYTIKSVLFFSPYFLLKKNAMTYGMKRFVLFSPFLLFAAYYFFIIVFKAYSFRNDINLSFLHYFPHFFIQLISVLFVAVTLSFSFHKLMKNK
jgi:hypothetical protein